MNTLSAPCMDRDNSARFSPLQALWLGLLALSAVHVRIAFDSPWRPSHQQGGDGAQR